MIHLAALIASFLFLALVGLVALSILRSVGARIVRAGRRVRDAILGPPRTEPGTTQALVCAYMFVAVPFTGLAVVWALRLLGVRV